MPRFAWLLAVPAALLAASANAKPCPSSGYTVTSAESTATDGKCSVGSVLMQKISSDNTFSNVCVDSSCSYICIKYEGSPVYPNYYCAKRTVTSTSIQIINF